MSLRSTWVKGNPQIPPPAECLEEPGVPVHVQSWKLRGTGSSCVQGIHLKCPATSWSGSVSLFIRKWSHRKSHGISSSWNLVFHHVHGKSHGISASKWLPSRQWQARWQTKRHHGTRGVCEDAQVAVVAVRFAARVTEALGRTFPGTFPRHIICSNSVYIRIYIYIYIHGMI